MGRSVHGLLDRFSGAGMRLLVARPRDEDPVDSCVIMSNASESVIEDDVNLGATDPADGAAELDDLRVVPTDSSGGEGGPAMSAARAPHASA